MIFDNVSIYCAWPIKKINVLIYFAISAIFMFLNVEQAVAGVKCNAKERIPFFREKLRLVQSLGGGLVATEYYYINNKHEVKGYVNTNNYLDMYKVGIPSNGLGYGTPTGYKWGNDWEDIFVVGIDYAVWINVGVDHWESIGGIATSNPSAINTSWNHEVYVRGSDKAIWVSYKANWESGDFTEWESIGGQSLGAPSVFRYGNKGGVQVRVCGLDNRLWVRYRKTSDSNSWGLWQHLKKR